MFSCGGYHATFNVTLVSFHEKQRMVPKWTFVRGSEVMKPAFTDKTSTDKVGKASKHILRVFQHYSSRNIGTTQNKKKNIV
jgi:hypothetical protein